MSDDVLLNKAAAIERSVRRAREEYGADDANLVANQTRQDAIIYQKLNLDIVRHILVERLDDFVEFTRVLLHDGNTSGGEARE